jgi:uncharacterized protein (DUF1330 family)
LQCPQYAKRANQAAAKYGAPGERFVVSEWESADKARAYYNSPEYAEAKAKRVNVAEATIMLFEVR